MQYLNLKHIIYSCEWFVVVDGEISYLLRKRLHLSICCPNSERPLERSSHLLWTLLGARRCRNVWTFINKRCQALAFVRWPGVGVPRPYKASCPRIGPQRESAEVITGYGQRLFTSNNEKGVCRVGRMALGWR